MTIIDYALPPKLKFRHKKRIMRVGGSVRPIDQVVEGGRKEKETWTKESLSYRIQNNLLCHVQKLMGFRAPVQFRHVPLGSTTDGVNLHSKERIIIVEQEYKWMGMAGQRNKNVSEGNRQCTRISFWLSDTFIKIYNLLRFPSLRRAVSVWQGVILVSQMMLLMGNGYIITIIKINYKSRNTIW